MKAESSNISGSAKDRSALWILQEAVRAGHVHPQTTVVESSSGNFALSLATFCQQMEVDFIPVIDPNTNAAAAQHLRRICRKVETVHDRDESGGFLLTRLARVADLVQEIDDAYWPDQYSNTDGARGHYEMTGSELVDSLGKIDYLFVGVGTGATITGMSQRLREANPNVVVIAVDVAGSAVFGSAPRRRLIPGIGSSIRPPLVEKAAISEVVTISEMDEVMGCRRLLSEHGIFAGGSTGGVFTAIERYFVNHHGPAPVVTFLCMDDGNAYRDTVYDDTWVTMNLEPSLASTGKV